LTAPPPRHVTSTRDRSARSGAGHAPGRPAPSGDPNLARRQSPIGACRRAPPCRGETTPPPRVQRCWSPGVPRVSARHRGEGSSVTCDSQPAMVALGCLAETLALPHLSGTPRVSARHTVILPGAAPCLISISERLHRIWERRFKLQCIWHVYDDGNHNVHDVVQIDGNVEVHVCRVTSLTLGLALLPWRPSIGLAPSPLLASPRACSSPRTSTSGLG
jgi:hypothetical protein